MSRLANARSHFTPYYASSSIRRLSARLSATRDDRASNLSRLSPARPALEFFWDLGFLDRVQTSSLTHHHE